MEFSLLQFKLHLPAVFSVNDTGLWWPLGGRDYKRHTSTTHIYPIRWQGLLLFTAAAYPQVRGLWVYRSTDAHHSALHRACDSKQLGDRHVHLVPAVLRDHSFWLRPVPWLAGNSHP